MKGFFTKRLSIEELVILGTVVAILALVASGVVVLWQRLKPVPTPGSLKLSPVSFEPAILTIEGEKDGPWRLHYSEQVVCGIALEPGTILCSKKPAP